MQIAITGSIATDHLMTFQGKFADSLVPDQLDKIALSFLVDGLDIRRGGCAANIAFGLGQLGVESVLIGSVGTDFDALGYRDWLTEHLVDCDHLRYSEKAYTARFVCTTDSTMAQLASFYPGAMAEARDIELAPIGEATGGFDLVVISPNDPEAMVRHTRECRLKGYAFAADPSQQLAWAEGDMIRDLIGGAEYLFSNDYEESLIEKKTGWSAAEVAAQVGTRVVTHGKDGVHVYPADGQPFIVAANSGIDAVDPTGVGDSFRSGFLAAIASGLSLERAAQVGCTVAGFVVETVGTQEYSMDPVVFGRRIRANYGDAAYDEIVGTLKLEA